jgi:hypothetical protein
MDSQVHHTTCNMQYAPHVLQLDPSVPHLLTHFALQEYRHYYVATLNIMTEWLALVLHIWKILS